MMFNPRFLTRTTLATALVSALCLSSAAHAGLLGGGGGGLTGGAGGGLTGGLGPRSLDIGGQASGSASRDGQALPRGEKAVQKVDEAKQKGQELGQTTADKAQAAKTAAADKAQSAKTAAGDQVSTLRERAGQADAGTNGGASAGAKGGVAGTLTPKPAAETGNAAPGGSTPPATGAAAPSRKLDASANGSAQASRSERSVNADASAQGSVSR